MSTSGTNTTPIGLGLAEARENAEFSSPTRKKARLSGPDLSSQTSRFKSPLSPSKLEARRKRMQVIEKALAEISSQRGRVKSPFSASVKCDDERNLFNTTNLSQAPSENNLSQPFSGASQISSIAHRYDTEINPFVSQTSLVVPHVNPEDQDADLWGDITEPEGAFLDALDETPSITNMASAADSRLDLLPTVTFQTGRLRPLELDAEAVAKARKVIEDISTEVDNTNADSSSLPPSSQSFSLIQKPLPAFKTPFKTSHIPEAVIALSQAYPRGSQRASSTVPTSSITSPSGKAIPLSSFSTPNRTSALDATTSSRNSTPLLRPLSTPNAKQPPRLGGYRARSSTATFVTPFKPGFRPGENGGESSTQKARIAPASETPHRIASGIRQSILPAPQLSVNTRKRTAIPLQPGSVFDPNPPAERRSLRDVINMPGRYSLSDLVAQGIPEKIPQVNPDNAICYRFHQTESLTCSSEPHRLGLLGAQEALSFLLHRGCRLATQPWVDCHWSLILWKKASMICCQPALFDSMWKFESICKDLLYHYERDLNGTTRPLVRLIQERDAPPSRPMVLCVSGMSWTAEYWDENKSLVEAHPELELTDGWYKIRAEVDGAIARAARRRKIRLGTKLLICGARLQSQGEPDEVLKSYSISCLRISGNATKLASWDSKLGLQPLALRTATLRSLNPDGGLVTLIDITIERLYPVGYYETSSEGAMLPVHNSAEEVHAQSKWEDARADRGAKIRSDLERRWFSFERVAEQASRAAHGWQPKPDDEEPNVLDDIFDELEEATDMNTLYRNMHLSAQENGWLALHIGRKIQEQKESLPQIIEKELESSLPRRTVRNFRIIRVRDARIGRRKAVRTAQITVWDVLRLGESFLVEAGRYLVSDLHPGQPGAWASLNEAGEIFLNTRQGTKWTRLRGNNP